MYKTIMGSEDIGVGRCREIATSSVGICSIRAKGQYRLCNACGQLTLVISFFDFFFRMQSTIIVFFQKGKHR